jgi:hypothetical protein
VWTALPGGDAVLKKWRFDGPVRRFLSVAKNYDDPLIETNYTAVLITFEEALY